MNSALLASLAQIPENALSAGAPRIASQPSSVLPLLLGALLIVFILILTFKTSSRNHGND
jgi:hypothetical protein